MRERRWQKLLDEFPELPQMRVLDVGGEIQFWRNLSVRPANVTMVNVMAQPQPEEDWVTAVQGDGCSLPRNMGEFDLVFSNSVIEHVGGHWRREQFAAEVRAASARYWVQTPYRYFPVEPHFLFPFFQHFPRAIQARIAVAWPIGNFTILKDPGVALQRVQETELIGLAEMRHYFPDAELLRERVAGLTKSLVAIKR